MNGKIKQANKKAFEHWNWYRSRFPNNPEMVNTKEDKREKLRAAIERSRK